MIIMEKYFEEKLSDREVGEFVSNIVTLKGDESMDVIYDEENDTQYINFRSYEEQLNEK